VAAALALVTVNYPNGGESLTIGSPIQIAWTNQLPAGTVFAADISYDGGATWLPIQNNSSSPPLAWTVAGPAGTRTRIRVRTLDGVNSDQSDADFTIAAAPATSGSSTTSNSTSTSGSSTSSTTATGTISISRPFTGDTWVAGTTASVQFQSTSGSPAVNFSPDGGMTWTRLQVTGVSNGSYQVKAPTTVTNNAVISLTATGGASATSRTFAVVAPITLTSPNGGETVTSGQAIQITWTHHLESSPSLSADVSYDGGTTWLPTQVSTTGVVATSNTGTLSWTVSGPAGPRTRIRVKGTYSPPQGTERIDVIDQSDADFTIVAR
jgi:hypothetical protein